MRVRSQLDAVCWRARPFIYARPGVLLVQPGTHRSCPQGGGGAMDPRDDDRHAVHERQALASVPRRRLARTGPRSRYSLRGSRPSCRGSSPLRRSESVPSTRLPGCRLQRSACHRAAVLRSASHRLTRGHRWRRTRQPEAGRGVPDLTVDVLSTFSAERGDVESPPYPGCE
jgi:hypothetical protein